MGSQAYDTMLVAFLVTSAVGGGALALSVLMWRRLRNPGLAWLNVLLAGALCYLVATFIETDRGLFAEAGAIALGVPFGVVGRVFVVFGALRITGLMVGRERTAESGGRLLARPDFVFSAAVGLGALTATAVGSELLWVASDAVTGIVLLSCGLLLVLLRRRIEPAGVRLVVVRLAMIAAAVVPVGLVLMALVPEKPLLVIGPRIVLLFVGALALLTYASRYLLAPLGDGCLDLPSTFVAHYAITPREAEIVCEVAMGRSNAEIARRMGVSPKTVKNHLYLIYQKVGTHSRTGLLHAVAKYGGDSGIDAG